MTRVTRVARVTRVTRVTMINPDDFHSLSSRLAVGDKQFRCTEFIRFFRRSDGVVADGATPQSATKTPFAILRSDEDTAGFFGIGPDKMR